MGRSSDDHQRNLQRFHHKSKILLNTRERDYLHDVLKQYHANQDLKKLIKCLLTVLDTPAKLDLLVEVRGLLPKVHLAQFDWLAPYAKMAHPVILSGGQSGGTTTNGSVKHMRKTRSDGSVVRGTNGIHANPATVVRMVTIDKDSDTLGFSIYGGSEHGKGIFINSVERGSVEESLGLCAGDQILEVNNISFDNITRGSASMVLQGNSRLRLKVQHWGRVHGNRMAKEKTSWYDTVQRMIVAGEFNDVDPSHAAMGGTRLLSGGNERRVIITLSSNRCIGLNIRGGMEYGVGIYVSKVDQGGLAESHGITVGDQIIDVNGVTTENATHAQAVELIRNQRCLIMTIRSVNRYPAYKELCNDYEWPVRDTHPKRRHSTSPTSGTNPLIHSELIDAIPLEVAEQYTQTHAHNESRDWLPNQSITMSPTPIPKSSRSSVATETATLIQKHIASTETGTSTEPPEQTASQAQSSTQASLNPASPNTDKRIGRSHSMKFPGEKALPSFETDISKKESQRVQRNRTFREVLFGMKMKSKDKKDKADSKQRGDKKATVDPKHMKKRYPTSASYASLSKKPLVEQTVEPVSRSEPSMAGWATRKDNTSLASSNPGSIARRQLPKQPQPIPAPYIPKHQRPSDPRSTAPGTQLPAAFQHGAGTQLMYSEATYASAMSVLVEMTKKLLNDDEQSAVMRHVKWYHQEGRIENLVPPILAILDKPEKILLLREIRGVIAPSDLGRFDSMVSRKELQAYENLQSGRKDPSQPMHSMRRNSIGKPKKTILEPKTDLEGKFFLQTPEDIQQDKRRQRELEALRLENLKEVLEESETEEDGDSKSAPSDNNSLDNSDIVMSLFDNPPKTDFTSPQSKSPDSNQTLKILNVPSSPKETKAKRGLWTDAANSNWEDEIVFAVKEVTVEKSPVTFEGHQQGSSSGVAGGPSERTGRESGFGSGDELAEKVSRKALDPDVISHMYLSQLSSGDEGGANWMLPSIEDDTLDDNISIKESTKVYDEEICGLDDSDDDVELPPFDGDISSGIDAADGGIKPNKSGLYSLVGTNNYHQDIGVHSNATSPAWSSPNTFSPISATSDMSLPPTPNSLNGMTSPAVPKTSPNSGTDPSSAEPIYAKVDLTRKRSKDSVKNSLSVEGSFDGSEGSESGRRSPFKVTFTTEYRGSPVPAKKSILKNSFRQDESPNVAKRKISSDYMDIEDINLDGPSASKEIHSNGKPPSKDKSNGSKMLEHLNAQMETMTVSLPKNRPSLGISISGGNDSKNQPEVRIDRIFPGGAASDDGTLEAGIEVLSVDGESLLSVSHPQAVDIIRKAYHNKNKATIEFVVKQSFEEVDTHL
ncbi:PDZ domain-containing protein 7-like [Asterias rubens]|uniref:PDZ domain-containing protein 7-like n=1 Tax=Asterias rubens TaxID=7604 RepID=UPI001455CA52|nr:PDZ domain-containing protein 7-like [Asterias rubens]